MFIEKIISGGEIGVGQAALTAAFSNGLKTGGVIRKGFKIPEWLSFAEEYNLIEGESEDINESIWKNVSMSEGTLRISHWFDEEKENSRLEAIKHYNKPYMDTLIFAVNKKEYLVGRQPDEVISWVIQNKIKILNIDGNSEEIAPGMQDTIFVFLDRIFKFNKNNVSENGEVKTTGGIRNP